jgi:hypothetical protein
MTLRLVLAGILLLSSALFGSAPVGAAPAIDLDRPGAFEALQRTNPDHAAKVRLILEGVARTPDSDVPRWMRVAFDARDVSYIPVVLTSHPAKRRLSFVLDTTRYEAVIVLTGLRGDIVPLR